jgi:phosphatidate cytidylyltransferase
MNESLKRSLSGVVYIVLLIFSTLFSNYTFLLLFGFFLLVATIEFCDLVNLGKMQAVVLSATLYILFSFFQITSSTKILLIIASLFVSLKLIYLLFNKSKIKLDSISKYVYLIGYVALPIIILTKIPTDIFGLKFKPQIIISIFILIWINDTFAYIVGKSLGKTKLFESISPKKTIEGFVGGVLFAVLSSVIIAKFYVVMPIYFWVTIALIVGIFGTIGDLIESKFKRNANVKDSGTIMPGHGGILDRLDSAIFVAPFIYLFIQIILFFNYD